MSGLGTEVGLNFGAVEPVVDRLLARTTGRLKADPDRLRAALVGQVRDHHRFLLQLHVDQIAALERGLSRIDGQLSERLRPFEEITARLRTMPGVSHVVAGTLVAEIGVDMRRFPSPGHLRSWVGLCPRLDESAGKRRSTRTRHGAPWLKTVFVQAAWVAVRNREGYPYAQYQRLKARRGAKKAIVAVAASLLTAAYCILRDNVEYRDHGARYFDQRDITRAATRMTKRLEALGFRVQLTTA